MELERLRHSYLSENADETEKNIYRAPPNTPSSALEEARLTPSTKKPLITHKNMGFMNQKLAFIVGLAVVGVVVFLLVVLLPLSYAYLDYYEMGFLMSRVGGSVDTSEVYFGGRHYVGVPNTFKTYRADAHLVQLKEIKVYNKEKLEISLSCTLQYFLREEDLKVLHEKYGDSYRPVLETAIMAALKNEASKH